MADSTVSVEHSVTIFISTVAQIQTFHTLSFLLFLHEAHRYGKEYALGTGNVAPQLKISGDHDLTTTPQLIT